MKNIWKIIIVLILAASVAAVLWLKESENPPTQLPIQPPAVEDTGIIIHPLKKIQPEETKTDSNGSIVMTIEVVKPKKLPILVDLGADKCIPCKMMAPMLEELKKEYADKFQVQFYDVWKYPAHAHKYNVRLIPTQIFLDPNGKELYRHQGFFSKEDILAKWKGLGVNLEKGTSNEKN